MNTNDPPANLDPKHQPGLAKTRTRSRVIAAGWVASFAIWAVIIETLSFATFSIVSGSRNRELGLGALLFSSYNTVGFLYHAKGRRATGVVYQNQVDPLLGYRLRPHGSYSIIDPGSGKDIWPLRTNKYGFISNSDDPANDQDITTNSINVIITGGSTVQGSGASKNSKTIAAQLERFLNVAPSGFQVKRPIRVINAGVGGYNSSQELIYMSTELRFLSPSIFIMLNGINENFDSISVGRAYHRNSAMIPSPLDSLSVPILPATQFVLRRFMVQIGLLNKNEERPENTEPLLAERNPADRYVSNIEAAAAIAHSADANFLYVLQPTSGVGTRLGSDQEIERRRLLVPAVDLHWRPYVARINRFYSDTLERLPHLRARYKTAAFVDGTRMLDDSDLDVYWDPRHYTDEGQLIIARSLSNILKNNFFTRFYERCRNRCIHR